MYVISFVLVLFVSATVSIRMREVACEGDNMTLQCPANYVMEIMEANYGRNNKAICHRDSASSHFCPTSSVVQTVRDACQGFVRCSVPAINSVFGDTCFGTVKYLDVTYQCRQASKMREIACEGDNIFLQCPSKNVIEILEANYGRNNAATCHRDRASTHYCPMNSFTEIIREACDGSEQCTVPTNSSVLGNTCFGTVKYLDVTYKCKSTSRVREIACEGDNITLQCTGNNVINILEAHYGRNNAVTCHRDPASSHYCPSFSKVDIVRDACQGSKRCSIPAISSVFGNICFGTVKYLDVTYECKRASRMREITCEGDNMNLQCPTNNVLEILEANYGRNNGATCQQDSITMNFCPTNSVANIVRDACRGRNKCSVFVSNSVFGNICFGTTKYLEVYFRCSPGMSPPTSKTTRPPPVTTPRITTPLPVTTQTTQPTTTMATTTRPPVTTTMTQPPTPKITTPPPDQIKPRGLFVYKKGRHVVGLAWSLPAGGKLDGFRITIEGSGKIHYAEPTHCVPWPSMFCFTIADLLPNTNYTFEVSAKLKNGDFEDGAKISAETVESAPGAPIELALLSVEETSATITWKPPKEANGLLRSFLVRIEQTNAYDTSLCCLFYPMKEIEVAEEAEEYSTEISGLSAGSAYGVSVTGVTAFLGAPAVLNFNTRPPTPSDVPPPNVRLNTSSEIKWEHRNVQSEEDFASLIQCNLLLLLEDESQGGNVSEVASVDAVKKTEAEEQAPKRVKLEEDLNDLRLLIEKAVDGKPFNLVAQYRNGDDIVLETLGGVTEVSECGLNVTKVPLTSGKKYKLAALQVLKYSGLYSVGIVLSEQFTADWQLF